MHSIRGSRPLDSLARYGRECLNERIWLRRHRVILLCFSVSNILRFMFHVSTPLTLTLTIVRIGRFSDTVSPTVSSPRNAAFHLLFTFSPPLHKLVAYLINPFRLTSSGQEMITLFPLAIFQTHY